MYTAHLPCPSQDAGSLLGAGPSVGSMPASVLHPHLRVQRQSWVIGHGQALNEGASQRKNKHASDE